MGSCTTAEEAAATQDASTAYAYQQAKAAQLGQSLQSMRDDFTMASVDKVRS